MVLTKAGRNAASAVPDPFRGKWLTLSNTTLGALLVAVNTSIILIALPDIFRGIDLNPLAPTNTSYFLWMLMGYMLMTAVLVMSLGRLDDMFGRVNTPARIDWWGNLTFAVGLIVLLVGITYGTLPYGGRPIGWTNPKVIAAVAGGVVILVLFCWVETKVADSMFHIRAFRAGNVASLLWSLGRGGMMFVLIIWLQGIWLPRHGYSFETTPLWAGIYMVPLTVGFFIAGPASGYLSDQFGARQFATGPAS